MPDSITLLLAAVAMFTLCYLIPAYKNGKKQ